MSTCKYNQINRLFLFLFLIPSLSWATEPYSPKVVNPLSESWRWKHFPELEGKGVRSIVEDANGIVWMGYNEGVFEYDGYTWKEHTAGKGLPASPVEEVFAARNGNIYAAASNGIFRYDRNSWTPVLEPEKGFAIQFHEITELSDGSLMFSTGQGAIHLSEKRKPYFYTSAARIENLKRYFKDVQWVRLPEEAVGSAGFNDISDVLEGQNGMIWFALTMPNETGRLLKFKLPAQPGAYITDYELIKSGPGFQLGEGQKLIQARDNKIWVINSTYKAGITIFNGEETEYIKLGDIFGGDEVATDIVQSSDGAIWVGSLGKLHVYRDGNWEIYTAPHYAIPANHVMLQKSQDNKLWVTGYKSKVFLLDFSSDRWISYAGLNFQCEASGGEQWFVDVAGKAVCRKGDNWLAYTEADGLIDAPIRIIITSQGQLWAAGSHRGVAATAVMRNGRWEKHLHPKLSWGIDYRAVFESREGALWFGGSVDNEPDKGHLGGVLQLKDPLAEHLQWTHHVYHENGLMQSNAYGIGQSPDGRIWLGGGSLYYFDGESWIRSEDERLRQFVNVVHSSGGWLIVGSRYYGVFIYDGKDWKNYDTSKGLPGNTIISIDVVSDSCLLVATENDICRFDGQSWVANIFPTELNMDFEGGSIFHDKQGSIWVNHSSRKWKRRAFSHSKNQDGIYHNFLAYRYVPDDDPPETEIYFFEKEVSPKGNTFVKWRGRDFFAQSASQRLTYSYRLDGGQWSPFMADQHYTFLGLSTGPHRLEVRARDLDLNIDPTPAVVSFTVLPPVWKQPWFILLILAFLSVLGIFEYRVISKKKKLEKLNASLSQANEKLKRKSKQIKLQNEEILAQKERILTQAGELEASNKNLEERNLKIRQQRDKLEEMVEQVEELSKAKLGFFTNISHELRTPLTLILGPAEQLQKQADDIPAAERRGLYDIIQRNAARLLKLINQLLELRRMENSSLELNLQTLDLPDFIDNILKLFENLAAERSIALSFTRGDYCGPVALDPDKVEKILANLLSNSFKHTPDGGQITVNLSTVTAAEAQLPAAPDHYLRITVQDTGEGILPEDLERIFDPYYSSGSLNRKEFSSGIGLSYIKDLVEAHRGRVRVESQKGEGALFLLYFPLLEPANHFAGQAPFSRPKLKDSRLEAEHLIASSLERAAIAEGRGRPEPPSPPANGHGKGKEKDARPAILIVEDNQDMLSFLEGILARNYEVRTAMDGKKGLEIAQKENFDLILSDVMMPEMDGLEFCELIKKDFQTSHIPVVLLTAKTMDDHKMAGYLTGADDYITKPFNPELLEVRIKNLLGQRRKLRRTFNRDFMLSPKEVTLTSPDEEMLQGLVQLMEKHIDDSDFNVNKMCEMVHLSHMHFIRKVRQLTGKTPSELLKSFRMKRAKDLLAQQKITISEVAYQVGYDLPNSFSRVFRQEFGMTPTEYVEGLKI
ncbi:MAG: response regulator [Lewinellaceae bacterium]|nr:response regulator [Lewinellaceae bacterium]